MIASARSDSRLGPVGFTAGEEAIEAVSGSSCLVADVSVGEKPVIGEAAVSAGSVAAVCPRDYRIHGRQTHDMKRDVNVISVRRKLRRGDKEEANI